jgi:hypothetical protein
MTTSNDIYSAMSGGRALKTYKKTILGRLYVTALNMLTGTPVPEGVILEGDPRKNDPKCLFDVFTEQEDYFFRKMNKRHFDEGRIIEYSRKDEKERVRTIEEFSDEELKALINKPFLALQNTLTKTTSVATLFRIESLARDLEKSEKVIRAIQSRLSEVQEGSVPQLDSTIEEEL